MLPLSQSHLSHLETCPRKYEYVFFDALTGPSSYEQHAKLQWGAQFHLLMQQKALNLPIDTLAEADEELSESLWALQAAAPEVFVHLPATIAPAASPSQSVSGQSALDQSTLGQSALGQSAFSQSEHRRTLTFNGYLLNAVYDLVVISTEPNRQGLIFDWKTHQQPPPRQQLERDWQTRLYLYLLCETSELVPSEISMTYWFVKLTLTKGALAKGALTEAVEQTRSQPSFYKFIYSQQQHEQTRRDLQTLTDRLSTMRESMNFPKVDVEKGWCDRCPFNVRCDRLPRNLKSPLSPTAESSQLLKNARQLTIDNVPEIPL